MGLPEAGLMTLRHGLRLIKGVLRNPTASSTSPRLGERRQRWNHIHGVLLEQAGGFVVHQGGMLDRMDSRRYRIFHAGGAMRVSGDFASGPGSFFDGGPELFERQLRLIRRGSRREDAARSDHFDDFGAGVDLFPYDVADLFRPFDFSGNVSPEMSTNHANREACSDDPRAGSEPFLNRFF